MKHLLILLFILSSCGSRKVETNKQVINTQTNKETTIEIKDSSNTSIKYDIEKEIFTIEAKDTSKPFIYNNKTYSNVVLRHEKIKDNTLYRKQNKVSYKQENKIQEKTNKVTKEKKIDRKESYFKYFFLIIILFILFFLWKFRSLFKL